MTSRVVTLAGDPEREASLAAQLSSRTDVDLVLRCMERVELLAAVRAGGLDAIVSVGAPPWLDAQCWDEASRAGVRIVGVVDDPLEAERLRSFGASLLTTAAAVDEIIGSCHERVESSPRPALSGQPSTPKGRCIAVWGPKGAPGRTTLAIELAAELAASEPETMLIDADPYGGDILQFLGVLDELPTVVWASRMAAKEELDAARLALDLRRAGSNGPIRMPGLARAELWAEVSDFGWRRLLEVARASYAFTVCDVGFCLEPERVAYALPGEGRNMMARTTIAEADHVVAVCRADAVGIKSFLWAFDDLCELVDKEDVSVVANRVKASEQREIGELIRRHLGKRAIAYVPDRPGEFERAAASGTPIKHGERASDVTSAIRVLAAALGGRISARGVLARLSGRA
jgi:MinD-like ATPase involved in chromosome partitioning or flagellar assembly